MPTLPIEHTPKYGTREGIEKRINRIETYDLGSLRDDDRDPCPGCEALFLLIQEMWTFIITKHPGKGRKGPQPGKEPK